MRPQPTQLIGIALGLGGGVLMWLNPADQIPPYVRWPLIGAASVLVVASVVSWLRSSHPLTETAMAHDGGKNINISSTNQSGGFTGILVQGNVHRTLDANLKAQLLQKLAKGKVGVAVMMGVPDGETLATAIMAFLHENGYTIESYTMALVAGGMPRGISIQLMENVPTIVINHA